MIQLPLLRPSRRTLRFEDAVRIQPSPHISLLALSRVAFGRILRVSFRDVSEFRGVSSVRLEFPDKSGLALYSKSGLGELASALDHLGLSMPVSVNTSSILLSVVEGLKEAVREMGGGLFVVVAQIPSEYAAFVALNVGDVTPVRPPKPGELSLPLGNPLESPEESLYMSEGARVVPDFRSITEWFITSSRKEVLVYLFDVGVSTLVYAYNTRWRPVWSR